MDSSLSVPRQALAELLRAAGSPLTPEQYIASLPEFGAYRKYPGRARAAAWSKGAMIFVAILGVLSLPFFLNLESVIVVTGLVVATYFEYRVHRYFRENDPRAPGLGFRNQSAFAAGILLYCIYHALVPIQLPSEYREMIDPAMIGMVQAMTRMGYLIIGAVAGLSQFALAWYYRNAASAPTRA